MEREIRAYFECRVLAHGFLRVHCDGCRMADTAAQLVDRVLPEVPIRQCGAVTFIQRFGSALNLACRILESLALPSRSPPLVQAMGRAPELQTGDDSIALLEAQAEGNPRSEFDQTWDDDQISNEEG